MASQYHAPAPSTSLHEKSTLSRGTSRIEAKQAALGHAANADDIATILKDFGHPVVVASRYSGRDYLIGPNLYPWFWDAQRVGVGLVLALGLIVLGGRALGADAPPLLLNDSVTVYFSEPVLPLSVTSRPFNAATSFGLTQVQRVAVEGLPWMFTATAYLSGDCTYPPQ